MNIAILKYVDESDFILHTSLRNDKTLVKQRIVAQCFVFVIGLIAYYLFKNLRAKCKYVKFAT